MTTITALYAAHCADPHDVTTVLVLADACGEEGLVKAEAAARVVAATVAERNWLRRLLCKKFPMFEVGYCAFQPLPFGYYPCVRCARWQVLQKRLEDSYQVLHQYCVVNGNGN